MSEMDFQKIEKLRNEVRNENWSVVEVMVDEIYHKNKQRSEPVSLKRLLFTMKAKEYANLIKEVAIAKGDERASKCGYDLMCGIDEGNADERAKVWKEALRGNEDTQEERNGVWVPAIPL